ncbi:MAG: hypothetical protein R3Y06_07660 [Faecalibacterium sp.]
MTIQKTIEMVDALRPNTIPEQIKIGWLVTLDASLRQSVVAQHSPEGQPILGKGADLDPSPAGQLLLPEPYHEAYHYWLCAQIDFALGEITRYSNSMALYNAAVDAFAAAYKAGHAPLRRGQFRI